MAREFAKPFYHSREWEQAREYALKRDNYLCRICGKPAEEVHHVRHLSPENIGDVRVSLNPDNLVCLCRACHFDQHLEDKRAGKKAQNRNFTDEYAFDENGLLVRITPPTQK